MNNPISRRSVLGGLAAVAVGRGLLRAADDATFSSNVNVVNVYATVRDEKGQIIRNLTRDDFVLTEDGKPQMIKYFSQESDLPLTLGFLVDTSGSTRKVLPDEKKAAGAFIDQVLRPDKDRAFLIHFDREVELVKDLTESKAKLHAALDDLKASDAGRMQTSGRGNGGGGGYPQGGGGWPGSGGGGGGGWPGMGGGRRRGGGYPGGRDPRDPQQQRGGGTLLYDSVLLASDELMAKQKGRKALILLSDGEDNGSKTTLTSSLESAQRADTLVYTILFAGESGGRFHRTESVDGKEVMQRIARETGGGFFAVSDKQPLDKVFAQIEDELRSQYSLGYSPVKGEEGDYRHISVKAKREGLVVQAREGYYVGAGHSHDSSPEGHSGSSDAV